MRKNEKYLDEMTDLMGDIFYKIRDRNIYDMEKDQPKHFSWLHVWWSIEGVYSDSTTALEYADAEAFQEELMDKIRRIFNTTTLEYISSGKIRNFGMHIGPDTHGDEDLNEELDIEVKYEQ